MMLIFWRLDVGGLVRDMETARYWTCGGCQSGLSMCSAPRPRGRLIQGQTCVAGLELAALGLASDWDLVAVALRASRRGLTAEADVEAHDEAEDGEPEEGA